MKNIEQAYARMLLDRKKHELIKAAWTRVECPDCKGKGTIAMLSHENCYPVQEKCKRCVGYGHLFIPPEMPKK